MFCVKTIYFVKIGFSFDKKIANINSFRNYKHYIYFKPNKKESKI